ncbi:MAG: ThiF family adenylyltransferase [Planctomycetota bacterium]|jgi:tRNA A37 threonylcarbamoyladenosine dehydratase
MTPATVFHEVTRRRPGPRPADRPAPAPAAGRLPAFIGGPSDAADRLASTSVLLVGAGSVGARIGEHLGRLGVGEVAVVDPKRFGPGLGTQAIEPADVGRPKASTVAARIKRISPRTRARWHGTSCARPPTT